MDKNFYPRSRKGSDSEVQAEKSLDERFLSTLPQGERRMRRRLTERPDIFLSTLPQGERRLLPSQDCKRQINFYPRSRKGSDFLTLFSAAGGPVFLSTLPQGERHTEVVPYQSIEEFLSTLPQGERPLSGLGRVIRVIFLSTLPQGERPFCKAIFPKPIKFLSTLPQGERRVLRIQ